MKHGIKEKDVQETVGEKNSNNLPQKKYLLKQKQLRVWMESEKFEKLKKLTAQRGTSIHRIVNNFVDVYIDSDGYMEFKII